MAPGWTNYHKTCFYNTYDVTDFVKSGKNCFGLYLGDGMFNVKKKRYVYFERTFGNMKFILQLHVVYQDGSAEDIISDEGVHMSESPLTYSGIYGGEDYDRRMDQEGFSTAEFKEDDSWEGAHIVTSPKGELRAESTHPMKVMEQYKPVKVSKTDSETYLYDLGKNFSGWVSIHIKTGGGCSGKQIIMRPAEILTEDKKPDQSVTGDGYCWNYICNKKKEQSYRPKFTYYGFRYVQVEGAVPLEFAGDQETKPIIESLRGEFIYPDVKKSGKFECSNDLFNQIHQIIDQAILSNMKSVFTDCPHSEKLGWLEETHLIGPSIMCGYDVRNIYQKIEKDMVEAQHKNGLIPDICPEYVKGFEKWHYGYLDSPEWGSACIIRYDEKWYMFYNAKNREPRWIEQTGAAVSEDLFHWKRIAEEPLLKVTKDGWDGRFVSDPYIVKDENIWLNYYFGHNIGHAQEGLALSENLTDWVKLENPIITHGEIGEIDETHAHKASIFYYEGVLYHFYCAARPYQEGDRTKIYEEFRTIAVAASKPVF